MVRRWVRSSIYKIIAKDLMQRRGGLGSYLNLSGTFSYFLFLKRDYLNSSVQIIGPKWLYTQSTAAEWKNYLWTLGNTKKYERCDRILLTSYITIVDMSKLNNNFRYSSIHRCWIHLLNLHVNTRSVDQQNCTVLHIG